MSSGVSMSNKFNFNDFATMLEDSVVNPKPILSWAFNLHISVSVNAYIFAVFADNSFTGPNSYTNVSSGYTVTAFGYTASYTKSSSCNCFTLGAGKIVIGDEYFGFSQSVYQYHLLKINLNSLSSHYSSVKSNAGNIKMK